MTTNTFQLFKTRLFFNDKPQTKCVFVRVHACVRACVCHMQCPQLSYLKDLLLHEELFLLLLKNIVIKTVKRKTDVEMYLAAGDTTSKFFYEDF